MGSQDIGLGLGRVQGAGLGAGWSRVWVLGLDLGRVLGWVRVWAGRGVQVLNSGRVQVLGPDLGRGQVLGLD